MIKNLFYDGFNSKLIETAYFEGVLEIPILEAPQEIIIPTVAVPFSKSKAITIPSEEMLVFYEHDFKFREFVSVPQNYIDELKHITGNDEAVQQYVMSFVEAGEFLEKLKDMLNFLIPGYIKEGKYQLVIAIGCTGGQHRSVTLANAFFKEMKDKGKYGLSISHRDIK